MFKTNPIYLTLTVIILGIEIAIALCLDSGFIRYTFGDVLASILVYTFIRSFFSLKPFIVAIISLFISFLIEGLQLINFTKLLHQEHNTLLTVVLGNHFSFEDLLAYSVGVLIIYLIDKHHIYETNSQ